VRDAFRPTKRDKTGISVIRRRFKSAKDAGKGKNPAGYFVARLLVSDLRANGLDVVPRPQTNEGIDHAHAELPDLNAGNRRTDDVRLRTKILAELANKFEVQGPYTAD
jgi:hypothetical protein